MRRWLPRLGVITGTTVAILSAVGWAVTVGLRASAIFGLGSAVLVAASADRGEVGLTVVQLPPMSVFGPIPSQTRVDRPDGPTLAQAAAHHVAGFGLDTRPSGVAGATLVVPLWSTLAGGLTTVVLIRRGHRFTSAAHGS